MSQWAFPPAMRRLVNELTKLPSIGEKTAVRLAYHLLSRDERDAFLLADAIREAREKICFCQRCFGMSETPICPICSSSERVQTVICVVEKPADVAAIERSGGYRGVYHVLHGLWSPLRGIGPEKTKIPQLLKRLQACAPGSERPAVEELVLATSTTVEGDATALYIANSVNTSGIKITRIAQGIPKGGELDYADEVTLSHAIAGRRNI